MSYIVTRPPPVPVPLEGTEQTGLPWLWLLGAAALGFLVLQELTAKPRRNPRRLRKHTSTIKRAKRRGAKKAKRRRAPTKRRAPGAAPRGKIERQMAKTGPLRDFVLKRYGWDGFEPSGRIRKDVLLRHADDPGEIGQRVRAAIGIRKTLGSL
jgi:hypothetical protein